MHAVLWRKNPAQNCSFFTPTTALSPEITFEKPELPVPHLPAELRQKYTDSFVIVWCVGFGGGGSGSGVFCFLVVFFVVVVLYHVPLTLPPPPAKDMKMTANTCLAR